MKPGQNMTIRDVLRVLSICPDDWEIWVWPQLYNRHNGQLLFGANFKKNIRYESYGIREYHFPASRVDEVAVYAMPPGFNEIREWKNDNSGLIRKT